MWRTKVPGFPPAKKKQSFNASAASTPMPQARGSVSRSCATWLAATAAMRASYPDSAGWSYTCLRPALTALLRRTTVAGPEQGVDFRFRGHPILDLVSGREATALGAQVGRLGNHRSARFLGDRDGGSGGGCWGGARSGRAAARGDLFGGLRGLWGTRPGGATSGHANAP